MGPFGSEEKQSSWNKAIAQSIAAVARLSIRSSFRRRLFKEILTVNWGHCKLKISKDQQTAAPFKEDNPKHTSQHKADLSFQSSIRSLQGMLDITHPEDMVKSFKEETTLAKQGDPLLFEPSFHSSSHLFATASQNHVADP